ncbi:MAG: DUF1385 domain-containing protein [Deltaproteobacteria bacterium]|nr:DUF1385 domain-containing protein [Deltaproteobacteria bacterium]
MLITNRLNVGGQAVIEGVMMRAPKSLAVAVRKPNGEIAVKKEPWKSISEKWSFLKLPFLRGTVVLLETLINGIQALTFSANQALEEEDISKEMTSWAIFISITSAMGLGLLLFLVLPHYLSGILLSSVGASSDVSSLSFHVVDGVIKVAFFIGYIWLISLWKDIRRVFEYHGAEHKSIYAYEAGEDLTVENARKYSTMHPRCGTSFIVIVIVLSIFIFSVTFPFLPKTAGASKLIMNLIYIVVKIFLMFPIAGIAYEFIKLSGRNSQHPLIRITSRPGLWVQKLTTREPSDDQIEIAIKALSTVLFMETPETEPHPS